MKRLSTLLITIVGIAVVILGVSCGEGAETEQVAQPAALPRQSEQVAQPTALPRQSEQAEQPAALPRQSEQAEQPAVEQTAEQQTSAETSEQTVGQEEADEEPVEAAPPPNRTPVADAGSDGVYDLSAGFAVLDGGGSHDPDGDSLTYEWTQVSGPAVPLRHENASSPQAQFDRPRTDQMLTFQLRVSDESGAASEDTVTLTFRNAPPTAKAGTDQTSGRGRTITLNGSGSDDIADNALTYKWSQISGTPVELSDTEEARPTFIAPDDFGILVFSLTVSDGEQASEPDTITITVRNLRPVADAGAAQQVETREWVTLDGQQSTDPDGDSLTYEWTQTSGDAVTLTLNSVGSATVGFAAPRKAQTLVFRLKVSDGNESTTDTVRITVNYEPVVASNFETANRSATLFYQAKRDAFTGGVRTDVRMIGPTRNLLLDVVCFDNGSGAIGFRLLDFDRDAGIPRNLEVMWRFNDGLVRRQTLDVTFLGETPAVYFQDAGRGFKADWPQVLTGGSLAVRINYRGVQEDVFNLDAFARTPVHRNLVDCGSY